MATWQSFYQARLSVQVAYQERKVKGDKNAQILLVFDHGNKMKQTHTETHAEVCFCICNSPKSPKCIRASSPGGSTTCANALNLGLTAKTMIFLI